MRNCEARVMDAGTFFETAKVDIERRLRANVEKYEEQEKLAYFLNHGKRLRPLLTYLFSEFAEETM